MTYCNGCAYLVYNKVLGDEPVCLRFAEFQKGYIRPKIDITNVWTAYAVNKKNDCEHKRRFSVRAIQMKRWLKRRTERGTDGRIEIELGRETYKRFTETEEKRKLEKANQRKTGTKKKSKKE